ncbi:MAG: tRNA (cytidine(34)-2'-O)-methyltransferase [Holdemanella sp.]|nr:tRNA (cytidine(34)-2'-O)-methyltransferase [Holdemanella sp.]
MIHVVLYEPEIPQNTGNIIRTCMATGSRLHLIEPLGFSLDEKHLKRSGMDYIKDADIHIHKNWEDFVSKNPSDHYYYMTRYGHKPPSAFDFTKDPEDIYVILGKESTGIDKKILQGHLETCMRLPMVASARSLNLSNCAAIIVYEILRQLEYPNLAGDEQLKGDHWLEDLQLD